MMANQPPAGQSTIAGTTQQPSRKKRVLIVEDERDITESIKSALKTSYWVDIGGIAANAIYSYKPRLYDLTILDYSMPTMDGIAFCHEVKKIDPSVEVLFITAYEEFSIRLKALKLSSKFNSILQYDIDIPVLKKPFDTATLRATIAQLIGEGV